MELMRRCLTDGILILSVISLAGAVVPIPDVVIPEGIQSINGSSVNMSCYSQNCLFDGYSPPINASLPNWAADLVTLRKLHATREIFYDHVLLTFLFEERVHLTAIEIDVFLCPEWNINVPFITVYGSNYSTFTVDGIITNGDFFATYHPPHTSCGCVSNISIPLQPGEPAYSIWHVIASFDAATHTDWVHVGEVRFLDERRYRDTPSTNCTNLSTIPNRPSVSNIASTTPVSTATSISTTTVRSSQNNSTTISATLVSSSQPSSPISTMLVSSTPNSIPKPTTMDTSQTIGPIPTPVSSSQPIATSSTPIDIPKPTTTSQDSSSIPATPVTSPNGISMQPTLVGSSTSSGPIPTPQVTLSQSSSHTPTTSLRNRGSTKTTLVGSFTSNGPIPTPKVTLSQSSSLEPVTSLRNSRSTKTTLVGSSTSNGPIPTPKVTLSQSSSLTPTTIIISSRNSGSIQTALVGSSPSISPMPTTLLSLPPSSATVQTTMFSSVPNGSSILTTATSSTLKNLATHTSSASYSTNTPVSTPLKSSSIPTSLSLSSTPTTIAPTKTKIPTTSTPVTKSTTTSLPDSSPIPTTHDGSSSSNTQTTSTNTHISTTHVSPVTDNTAFSTALPMNSKSTMPSIPTVLRSVESTTLIPTKTSTQSINIPISNTPVNSVPNNTPTSTVPVGPAPDISSVTPVLSKTPTSTVPVGPAPDISYTPSVTPVLREFTSVANTTPIPNMSVSTSPTTYTSLAQPNSTSELSMQTTSVELKRTQTLTTPVYNYTLYSTQPLQNSTVVTPSSTTFATETPVATEPEVDIVPAVFDVQSAHLTTDDKNGPPLLIIIIVVGIIVLCLFVLIAIIFIGIGFRRREYISMQEAQISGGENQLTVYNPLYVCASVLTEGVYSDSINQLDFTQGGAWEKSVDGAPQLLTPVFTDPTVLPQDIQSPIEITADNLSEVKGLGIGRFGEVVLANTKGLCLKDRQLTKMDDGEDTSVLVAVKKVKPNLSQTEREAFDTEVKFLSHLKHPNIVHILGVCYQDPAFVVIEYMDEGDLNQFLQKYKEIVANPSNDTQIATSTLLYMSSQIAKAMLFLNAAAFDYIHRDIATRKCLVGKNHTVKIADLGVDGDIYRSHYYCICGNKLIPIRWMAVECFDGKFSEKSDVWAFGMTMWELFTLAKDVPYSHLSDEEVIQNALKIEDRQFPSRPAPCPLPVYEIMKQCWIIDLQQRATFREVNVMLQTCV